MLRPCWLLICCIIAGASLVSAENDGGGDDLFAPRKPADAAPAPAAEPAPKPAAEAPPAPPSEGELRPHSNAKVLASVRDFCASKGLAVNTVGAGRYRVINLGGNFDDAAQMVEMGQKALELMELWAGKPGVWVPAQLKEDETISVCLFGNDGDFDAWVDAVRAKGGAKPEGEDLTKKTKNLNGPWTMVSVASKAKAVGAANLGAYTAIALSLDGLHGQRGITCPAWIREGCNAEAQRQLCDGKILVRTIAYEDNKNPIGTTNWPSTFAKLIKAGDKNLLKASLVMDLDLVGRSATEYIQMWSLCAYMISMGNGRKHDQNKFYQLLQTTSKGTLSARAVDECFKLKDPALSRAWATWALQMKD